MRCSKDLGVSILAGEVQQYISGSAFQRLTSCDGGWDNSRGLLGRGGI